MSHGQPRILFVSLSDDVGSERIVCEMGRRGAACAVMSRAGAVAALSSRVSLHHPLPSRGGPWAALGVGRGLAAVVRDWHPDAAVPLDDMAAAVLRDLAAAPRTAPAVRRLLQASLGDPRHYRTAGSRARLIEAAAGLGLRTPPQRPARDAAAAMAAVEELGFPLMVKREGTCGGKGVVMVRDRAELAAAFRTADRRARAKRLLRRLAGFRPDREAAAVTLQAHVAGVLALHTVACDRGEVLDGVSFAAELLDPPVTGSSTVLRPIHHPEMEAAAARLAAALGLSGFASFDFILSADGAAHLIELNARPVGSGHLASRFGRDPYGAWLAGLPGFAGLPGDGPRGAGPRGAEPPPHAVALFPKEIARDPTSRHLAASDVFHDVPWDEPSILEAYRARVLLRHPGAGPAIARVIGPARPGAGDRGLRRAGRDRGVATGAPACAATGGSGIGCCQVDDGL